MTFSKLYLSILNNPDLSSNDKVIFSVLLNLDKEHHCIASNRYLSKVCSVCENTITNTVSRLENLGLISVTYGKANHRTIICEQQEGFFIELPDDIVADENLTATDKIVLSKIIDLESIDKCYASNEYLSEKCGVSVKTISRSIKSLIENGYICIEETHLGRIVCVTDKIGEDIYNIIYNKKNYSKKNSSKAICSKESNSIKDNNKGNSLYKFYISIYNSVFPTLQEIKEVEIPLLKSGIDAIDYLGGIGARIKGHTITKKHVVKIICFLRLFALKYHKYTGKVHPYIKADDIFAPMVKSLSNFFETRFFYADVTMRDLSVTIDRYFKTKFNKCDYRFCMFVSPGVFLRKIKEMERITGHFYNVGVEFKIKETDNNDKWYLQDITDRILPIDEASQEEKDWWGFD